MADRRRALSHLDDRGRARMVDVGGKDVSERYARARASVRMGPATARAVLEGSGPKGEVLAVARLAGVQAAKETARLIPLAHPLPLTSVHVDAAVDVEAGLVELTAEARTVARTGVEMEAMTACAVAALTVYDMVKGIERGVRIEDVSLLEKRGGRSDYVATDGGAPDRGTTGRDAGDGEPPDPGASGERRGPLAGEGEGATAGAARKATAAVITVSTSKAEEPGLDESGPQLRELAVRVGAVVVGAEVIPDDRRLIEARLRHWADRERCSMILTSGGTGLSPTDLTPEATLAVLDREAPGIAEAIRESSREHTPHWMLSRGVAGVRGSTLIVNLPGNPASIEQVSAALAPPLLHALELLAGKSTRH